MDADRIKRERAHYKQVLERQPDSWWGNFTEAGRARLERRKQLAIELASIGGNEEILEIGCASGEFTSKLMDICRGITGVDISFELLALMQKKINQKKVRSCMCDAERLPFRNSSFDIVLGNAVLHHLDIRRTFAEIARVLRKGGRIVFFEPNMLNPQVFLEKNVRFFGRLTQNSPDESAFFRWQIKNIARVYFYNVRIIPFDFLHPLVPDLFIKPMELIGKMVEHVPLLKEIAGSLVITAERL